MTNTLQSRIENLEAREQRRLKRNRRLLVLGILGAVTTPFAVQALGAVPHVFSSGEPIVASEINENFAHVTGGVTAVEARTTVLEAVPTGLYCGGSWTNGLFMSGTLRGFVAARDLCRTACGGSPTAHMCTMSEAAISFQLGLIPSAPLNGWVMEGSANSCYMWARGDISSVFGSVWSVGASIGPSTATCDSVRPIYCCE